MSSEKPEPLHPAEAWCAATTKEGKRCLNNAVADGLCRKHWRMAYERSEAAKKPQVVFEDWPAKWR